ncbi:MAG: hypothetical protein JXQ79_10225 [Rhodobacteraceae bacterium]|nr:hypothetical protein [Paracoccaceae bacterium]
MKITRNQSLESHFPAGLAVVLIVALFGASPLWALAAGLAAAVLVELVQGAIPALGAAEMKDVVYTAMGAGAGYVLLVVA